MKTCLVTGCTGLIGSHLIPSLIEDGWFVYGIIRSESQLSDIPNYHPIVIDLASGFDINALPNKVDVIIHLAQSRNFREFPELATEIFRVNTEITLRLLDYGRKAQANKFVLASTGGVYGTNEFPFKEDAPWETSQKMGFYAGTKICSEILANTYNNYFDIDILRLFFVYGKGQEKSMLIPRIITNIWKQTAISLQGKNGISINPIYVSDVISALRKTIRVSGSKTFNIAGNEILSLRDISNIIGEKLNRKPLFSIQQTSFISANNLIGDITAMKENLLVPQVSFWAGIDSLIEEFKSQNNE